MPKRILLADDSAAVRTSVEQTFGTADYQVIVVEDGRSAMEQVETLHPHLVLAHAMLPGIDGYEVCRRVKETPGTSHIPVLLLTGTFEPFDIKRAKEARYDGFITKPLDGSELLGLVERCIGKAVYPAVEPVQEEPPEPESAAPAEGDAPEATGFSVGEVEAGTGDGSDAMLDRIFPEDPGEGFALDGETVTIAENGDDDIFSIVEPADSLDETAEEPDQPRAPGSTRFSSWGGRRGSEPMETPGVEQTAGTEKPGEEEKPEVEEEGGDLSWFLRKYEEKQQRAGSGAEGLIPEPPAAVEDEETAAAPEPELTAADPFSFNADDDEDVSTVEEFTLGTEPEPPVAEETDPGKEAVEPLPVETEAPAASLPPPPVKLDDRQLEQISRRVVELLSESVVRDVAWEAVPDIAERLIRERIREIEAEAETAD